MEPATMDRIQRMIDDEMTGRFPAGAVPRLVLVQYGDEPVIGPGELYLRLMVGQDLATRDAWMEEHGDVVWDFRAQRLPEVKGLLVTADRPDPADRGPTGMLHPDGISMLDPREDEIARGLTPVMVLLSHGDLETLDALVTAGIAASRPESVRWALARVREQPAYAEISERPREPGGPKARAGLDRAAQDRLQSQLDEQVKELFPDGEVRRVVLLQYGDDPWVEPGDLVLQIVLEAEEEPSLRSWDCAHEALIHELHRQLAEKVPEVRYLEFYLGGDTRREGWRRMRLGCLPGERSTSKRDLTPVGTTLGPVDLEMLDTLILEGIAASRTEAIGWVLARIRERPAYAKLGERARELDELKARF